MHCRGRRRAHRELADEVVAQVDADRVFGGTIAPCWGLKPWTSLGWGCERLQVRGVGAADRDRDEHRDREQRAADDGDTTRVTEQRRLAALGSAAGPSGFAGRSGTDRHGIAAPAGSRHRALRRPRWRARGVRHVCPGAADPDNPAGTLVGMAGSTVADLVGRVLAGRYRLLGSIGCGRERPGVRRRRRPAAPPRRGEGAPRRACRTTRASCAGSAPRRSSRRRCTTPT